MPRQRKRLLIARWVVLAHRSEGLIFVADKDGGPEVDARRLLHPGRTHEKRLQPGVLEHHAHGSGQRRVRPGGHVQGQHLAPLDQFMKRGQVLQFFDLCPSTWRNRRRLVFSALVAGLLSAEFLGLFRSPGLNGNDLRIIGDFRRVGAKHLGHIGHVEHGKKHRDPLDNRGLDLVVQRLPVVDKPALHRLHPLPYLVAGSRIPGHPVGQLEFAQFVAQWAAVNGPLFLRICRPFPHPFRQLHLVCTDPIAQDEHRALIQLIAPRFGLLDLGGEELRVDGAAVDLLQRHPPFRERPVKLDDPAHQIGIGLLPEGFFALAKKLIEKTRNGVGQRVGIEPPGRERVPLPAALHAQFDVVFLPPRIGQDPADVVTEIPFDFEHQRSRPLQGILRLPGEELTGERVHASRSLPGPDGPEDRHASVQSPLRDGEPGGIENLPCLDRVMDLPNDDGRGLLPD